MVQVPRRVAELVGGIDDKPSCLGRIGATSQHAFEPFEHNPIGFDLPLVAKEHPQEAQPYVVPAVSWDPPQVDLELGTPWGVSHEERCITP